MSRDSTRIVGLDPGLCHLGWGVVDWACSKLTFVACGAIATDPSSAMGERLATLFRGLDQVLSAWHPTEAAIEETFVNGNARSALKLGQARGVALLAPATRGLSIAEYAPNSIKKTVTGNGHAEKVQVEAMIRFLLPRAAPATADAADALAVAITHAHHRNIRAIRTRFA